MDSKTQSQAELREQIARELYTQHIERPMASPGALTDKTTVQDFQIPLGRGATAVLTLPVPLSPTAFAFLKTWLDLMAPALTDEPTPSVPPEA